MPRLNYFSEKSDCSAKITIKTVDPCHKAENNEDYTISKRAIDPGIPAAFEATRESIDHTYQPRMARAEESYERDAQCIEGFKRLFATKKPDFLYNYLLKSVL